MKKMNKNLNSMDAHYYACYESRLLSEYGIDCYAATKSDFLKTATERSGLQAYERLPFKQSEKKVVYPEGKTFAACLTHDVDNTSKYNLQVHVRRLISQIKHCINGCDLRAMRSLRSTIYFIFESLAKQSEEDPLFCYETWLAIEKSQNVRSTFLFLPNKYQKAHYTDAGYRYDDEIKFDGVKCSVGEFIREVHHRGWEVGLHGSWYSFDDTEIFKRQKFQLEDVVGHEVISSRQHNLHFDIRQTPSVLQASGIKVDSSIGFNDICAYRYKTSKPWQLDIEEASNEQAVLEIPLCIQDKAIMKVVEEESFAHAINLVKTLVQQAKNEGGVVCLLWHPRTILWPEYISMYEHIIKLLKEEGAWFGTMGEVHSVYNREQKSNM